jgi:hypothetical protein
LRWFTFTWLVIHFFGESNSKGHPITCLRRHTWRVVVQLYNLHTRWGWWSTPRPSHSREGVLVPIVEEARWAARPVWTCMEKRKSLPSQNFEPRTAQEVASRYTDYAIPQSSCGRSLITWKS